MLPTTKNVLSERADGDDVICIFRAKEDLKKETDPFKKKVLNWMWVINFEISYDWIKGHCIQNSIPAEKINIK